MRDFDPLQVPRPQLDFNFDSDCQGFREVDLEIGAGQGLHAIRRCEGNADRLLLACEKTHTRFEKFAQRHKNHSLPNLKPFHVDAVAFVSHYLPVLSLSEIFLLYPNPYPKTKQANLRWHNRPFLKTLLSKLKPGGGLTIATNLLFYADEAENLLTSHWNLKLLARTKLDPLQDVPRTHFEKKYLERGETCWNLRLRKLDESDSIAP